MANVNLIVPKDSMTMSENIKLSLNKDAQKLISQLERYHEAIFVLGRIKIGFEYYIKKNRDG